MLSWWMWMILGLVLLACEMLAPGTFYFMFFGISGLLAGVVAWLAPDMPAWGPWLLFSVFSAISVMFFRKPIMEKFQLTGKGGERVDSLVGETCTVIEDIAVAAVGKAELRGASWSARNVGSRPLTRAERCTVERVDGLMLHIRNQ